jgi:DNA-directed RNA polymerase specialized sigma24 family protein
VSEHPGQAVVAALNALLEESAPEEGPRADGWAVVLPLWRKYLFAVGARMGLQQADIEDKIQEVLLDILARWEEHRRLGSAKRLLALSRQRMHDKVVDEIRRRDRQRGVPLEALPAEPVARGVIEGACSAEREEWNEYLHARMDELKGYNEEYYELVYGHRLKGRSCEELAAEKGRSAHAIECIISGAIEWLRQSVAEHPPGGGPLP